MLIVCVCAGNNCECGEIFCRDVDDVHDLMDDIQEQNEVATEISDALSQPIGFNQEIDDVSIWLSCDQSDNYYSVDKHFDNTLSTQRMTCLLS